MNPERKPQSMAAVLIALMPVRPRGASPQHRTLKPVMLAAGLELDSLTGTLEKCSGLTHTGGWPPMGETTSQRRAYRTPSSKPTPRIIE
jgi:hypothetical protein